MSRLLGVGWRFDPFAPPQGKPEESVGALVLVSALACGMRSMRMPEKPLKSVSTHILDKGVVGRVHRVVEVIYVVDANGDLWQRDGSGPWEKVY